MPGFAIAGTLAMVNCGGGGGPSTTPSVSSPTSAPAQATQAPAPLATSIAIPSGGGTVTFPAIGGLTSTMTVAAGAPANDMINVVESLNAPSNAPAPSSVLRSASALSVYTIVYTQIVSVTQPTPLSLIVSHFLTLTSGLPSTPQYYLELDDITPSATGAKLEVLGPATISNLTLEWDTPATDGSIVLQPGETYLFQAYYGAATTAVPTPLATGSSSPRPSTVPTPSPSPTSSPTAQPTASGAPVPQPPAAATSAPSIVSSGATLTLPSFGGYSGTIPYAPFLGSPTTPSSVPLNVLFANSVSASTATSWAAPIPLPTTGAVYAIIAINYPLAAGAQGGSAAAPNLAFQSFTATEAITTTRVSLTIPGLPNFLTGWVHAYHVTGSPPYTEVSGYPLNWEATGSHVSWVSPFGTTGPIGRLNPGDSVVFVLSQQ